MTGNSVPLSGIRIPILLTKYPPMRQNVVILDTESENDRITVLGFYRWGMTHLIQIYFPQPVVPAQLANTNYFQSLLVNKRIAVYNSAWEGKLFGIPSEQLLELSPFQYVARSEFIQIQSLDKVSSKFMVPWQKENYTAVLFHNYSCLIHAIMIFFGYDTYAQHNVRKVYAEMVKPHV